MFKKALIPCLLLISSWSNLRAGHINPEFFLSDTTDLQKKDSLLAASLPADPKQGFKDLFVEASATNGVRVEQLNPLAIGFVEDYIEKFGPDMEELKDWGKPYFDMMDVILSSHGLPKELKYLAVVESRLKTHATSWAGAVGPWQFMPTTARTMGLKVGRKVDERRDLYKSTHAASRYLVNLYSIYGDWLLVIAAYNGGPGKVNSAIKRSGSKDFWTLQKYLPAESSNHVKKFIATHFIMEGAGGITTLTKKEAGALLLASVTAVNDNNDQDSTAISRAISGRYLAAVLIKHIQMEMTDFNKINPGFDRQIADEGKYELRLPADKMELFLLKKPDILAESIQLLLNPGYASQVAGTSSD